MALKMYEPKLRCVLDNRIFRTPIDEYTTQTEKSYNGKKMTVKEFGKVCYIIYKEITEGV